MSNTARTFRLPVEVWAAMDAAAAERGQTRTLFVRRALEEALGGSRVGTSGQDTGLPKGPELGADVPVPSPRASAAEAYAAFSLKPVPVAVELQRGKRPGGFVPRPKKGS